MIGIVKIIERSRVVKLTQPHAPVVVALCIMLLTACAGGTQVAPLLVTPGLQQFPPPSQLHLREYPAQASFADITLNGTDYSAGLPSQRIEAEATELWFHSNWKEAGNSYSDLAFACYQFSPGFSSGPFSIITSWSNPPDAGNFYLGIADYIADKWQWHLISDSGTLALNDASSYMGMHTQLLVAVVILDASHAPPPPDPKLATITMHDDDP